MAGLSATETRPAERRRLPRTAARPTLARAYCLIAGLLDAATGVVLVASPRLALSAMGIEQPPTDLVLLRWIGAFVGAVGLCYLYPFVLGALAGRGAREGGNEGVGAARDRRLAIVLELTVIPRLAVFAFTTGALATGDLSIEWVSVPFTDLTLAIAQLWMIRSGWLS